MRPALDDSQVRAPELIEIIILLLYQLADAALFGLTCSAAFF